MKRIKRIIALICAPVLAVVLSLGALAAEVRVFGEDIRASRGQRIEIPVNIRGNPGLMGFKIKVTYPQGFSEPEVKRGELLSGGIFNDSILDDTTESFFVIWSGVENMKADGELFTVSLSVGENADYADYAIELSAVQADTFNEKYEDVALVCGEIRVTVAAKAAVQAAPPKTAEPTAGTSEELQQLYISDLLLKIDSGSITAAVNETLGQYGVSSAAQVPSEKRAEFVSAVERELETYAPDIEGFEKTGLDTEQAIKAIDALAEAAVEYATQGVNVSEAVSGQLESDGSTGKTLAVVFGTAGILIIISLATFIIARKMKKCY